MSKPKVLTGIAGIIVFGLIVLISWVFHSNQIEHLPAGMPADYPKRWLNSDSCVPPCWEGIIPGVTTADEAIKIMNQNSAVIQGSAFSDELGSVGYVAWDWLGTDLGGEALYNTDDPTKTIYQIRPQFGYIPGANPVFTLQDVIESYGEPSHIAAYGVYGIEGQGPFYTVILYWKDLGISINQGKALRRKPRLTPSMEFAHVQFHALPFEPDRQCVPWQGYKAFDEYCTGKPGGVRKDKCILFP